MIILFMLALAAIATDELLKFFIRNFKENDEP